jgi:hypothetical protein
MDKGSYSCGCKDKEASSFRKDEMVGDGRLLKPHVEEAKKRGKVIGVYADGSYDSKENFDYLKSNGIEPIIKVRKDS